ncbi:MAG: hypothetical protein ABFC96_02690 [Thermoguttaceae bacterium]
MSIFSRLRLAYHCFVSRPAADRPIYGAIRRGRVQKIVELGIGDGQRALDMIDLAKLASPAQDILYVALDPFEGGVEASSPAESRPGLTLKAAHQLFRSTGVRVQLLPGNPADSLMRMANSLGKIDLLIVPAELVSTSYARLWFFVPRMLHAESLVFAEQATEGGAATARLLPHSEIESLAAASAVRRAA